jgi:type IV pilus assembly protein PilE
MKRTRGFTLLELMIVVAVIAILATLAMSGYQKQIRKSRRAEAKQVLSDLVLKQEKWRSNNAAYGTVAQIGGAASTSYYSICPVAANCTTSGTDYVLIAVPVGDQLKDSCGTLTISMVAGTLSKCPGPSPCATTSPTDCW